MPGLAANVKLIELINKFDADVDRCVRRKLRDWPLAGYSFKDGFEYVKAAHRERCVKKWIKASPCIDAGEVDPRAWVFRQVYDEFSEIRRQEQSRGLPAEPFSSWLEVAASVTGPASKLAKKELAERLYEAMRNMSAEERQLVELRMDDLTFAQIAQIQDLKNEQVARHRYVDVIRRLKDMLESSNA